MEDFRNPALSISERVESLLSLLTYEEKAGFVNYKNEGVPRLGIPPYSWWNEALHGLARSGCATVFPQSIAMAATFSPELVEKMGQIIALETRARHEQAAAFGDYGTYKGLTLWSPNINIFRDPRWGRGQETYGECPFLTTLLGCAFVKGVQGPDAEHLNASACVKHFAVHSGPEGVRLSFNSQVSEKDMNETYLRAFRACVKAGVSSVMTAYNAINGTPCCLNRHLIEDVLRKEWGFQGVVVTDVGCCPALVNQHKVKENAQEAVRGILDSGVDVISTFDQQPGDTKAAVLAAKIPESTLDHLLRHQLELKIRLGFFDEVPPTPLSVIECREHRMFARECARRSIVLLKNADGLLPLDKEKLGTIAVIGPAADNVQALIANYAGTPTRHPTFLQAILQEADESCRVLYALGSDFLNSKIESCAEGEDGYAEAVSCASQADVTILCVGLTHLIEGEGGVNPKDPGDKADLELPPVQRKLLELVSKAARKLIVVNVSGSDIHIPEAQADALLQVFYPGAEGGTALSEILFGKVNPSGKLPLTFYESIEDLPDFRDYSMAGRTYRYFTGKVQYPFGFGLSYTTFAASKLLCPEKVQVGKPVELSVDWSNTGKCDGEDVIQVYVHPLHPSVVAPVKQLAAVRRVALKAGESMTAHICLPPETFQLFGEDGRTFSEPDTWEIQVGNLHETLEIF